MKELENYRRILRQLPEKIKEAEAEAEKSVQVEATVSGGVTMGMGFSEKTELYIRATGEKTGMVYTEKLSMNPEEALERAWENSLEGEEAERMNDPETIQKILEQNHLTLTSEEKFREYRAAELDLFGKELEKELLRGCRFAQKATVTVTQVISTIGLVNSKGADVSGSTGRFDIAVSVSHKENPMWIYEETISVPELSSGLEDYFLKQLTMWNLTRMPSTTFTPGTYRAVLSSQVVNFILVTAWQMFTAQNYRTGRSPLQGKLGEKIFSAGVRIVDYRGGKDRDNGINGGYSFELDAEGTPCQDTVLVEDGVLTGLLYNLSEAEKAGVLSTGNAGRKALLSGNIHTDMTIIPRNFTIESGKESLEELLQKCGDGIYLYEAYDQFHSLNVVTGDFTFPCKGILVENGQRKGSVSGLSMNGNVLDLFGQIEALGQDRKIEPMAIYHNYEVSGPAMLVSSIRVSG